MTVTYDCLDPRRRPTGVAAAIGAVRRGGLVVLPTDIAYGLGCDAFHHDARSALRNAKGLDEGAPLAVMVGSPRTLPGIADVDADTRRLAEAFWPGLLTLVCRVQPSLAGTFGDDSTVSVRMPLHPLALDVLREIGPMVLTGAVPVTPVQPGVVPRHTQIDTARDALGDLVNVYLDGGTLPAGQPSTVLDVSGEVPRVLRAGGVGLDLLRSVVPGTVGAGP